MRVCFTFVLCCDEAPAASLKDFKKKFRRKGKTNNELSPRIIRSRIYRVTVAEQIQRDKILSPANQDG